MIMEERRYKEERPPPLHRGRPRGIARWGGGGGHPTFDDPRKRNYGL